MPPPPPPAVTVLPVDDGVEEGVEEAVVVAAAPEEKTNPPCTLKEVLVERPVPGWPVSPHALKFVEVLLPPPMSIPPPFKMKLVEEVQTDFPVQIAKKINTVRNEFAHKNGERLRSTYDDHKTRHMSMQCPPKTPLKHTPHSIPAVCF